jgi:hypothetical protein
MGEPGALYQPSIRGRIFMRFAILALAGGMLLASTAAYADDPMAMTYGNTIKTTNKATGDTTTLLFNADGSYTANGMAAGKPVQYAGKWSLKDDGKTICLAPTLPPNAPGPAGAQSCSPLQTHNVGDNWTVTNDQNMTFDISLTAGR